MNVQKLEELVKKLAKDVGTGKREAAVANLQKLEYFAYGVQGSPETDPASGYILSQVRAIRSNFGKGLVDRANKAIATLEGYVARLSQEPVQYTTNGEVKDTNESLVYIADQKIVKIGDREIPLNGDDALLMEFLYKNPGIILTRGEINQGAWGGRKSKKGVFGYTLRSLLGKIQSDVNGPQYVQQFYRKGLMFTPNPNKFSYYPKVEYDPKSGLVNLDGTKEGIEIKLTGKQKSVMDLLYLHPNTFHSIEEISKAVWGEDTKCTHLLAKNAIYLLKKKLTVDSHMPSPILGTRKDDYMLKVRA